MEITLTIDDDTIHNILCCAFEGGSNYWYVIEKYDLPKGITIDDFRKGGKLAKQLNDGITWHPAMVAPLVEGCAVIIRDIEKSEINGTKSWRLDRAAIVRGLKAMQEKSPRQFGNLLSGNEDGDTGDVFLQCCLFGEVVFG